ncbi:MAG TPA: Crp/Fnr family transcriptional regulator [Candidatus Sulfotelmatobacter sp.]|nr:Crp/Fnr family transcriptional regulator [Candidatus Sulfotelmatobacter sp.]
MSLLQLNTLQTLPASVSGRTTESVVTGAGPRRCRGNHSEIRWTVVDGAPGSTVPDSVPEVTLTRHPEEVDPLYLFACHLDWEEREEPGAAWELIAAAQSSHSETRAHARALLSASRHLGGIGPYEASVPRKRPTHGEDDMKVPYGLEIIEDCRECTEIGRGHFCEFSQSALNSLTNVSHKSVLPAGAILFVEGQTPRGVFIICSGKVNLSTTSGEGKILILKTANPGEALGLSAAVSGVSYETTAETATPCHVGFVDRKHFVELMQNHPEIGLQTAQCLSRDYQSAYRDIHDLVLTRSSAGKLALALANAGVRGPGGGLQADSDDPRGNGDANWSLAGNRDPTDQFAEKKAADSSGWTDAGNQGPHGDGGFGCIALPQHRRVTNLSAAALRHFLKRRRFERQYVYGNVDRWTDGNGRTRAAGGRLGAESS